MERFTHRLKISEHSGSHFEVGKQLGERAKTLHGENYVDKALSDMKESSLYAALGMEFELTPKYIEKVFPVVEEAIGKVHDGLLQEMQGFAAGLGENYQRFLVFTSNFGNERGCSQFFLNGYHARNYDDDPKAVENEFLLLHTQGSNTSFGASTSYIERLDGMNEKGLAVSLTFGAGYPPKKHGIGSAMYQRIVLDKASTVNEALEIFNEVPYVTPNNVLISDATGDAALIEQSAGVHRVRRIKENMLFCANSYLDPDMKVQQRYKNPTTVWRERKMEKEQPKLETPEAMMDFLTSDFPNGLFEPYFTDGLGTLWSVIYHPESRRVYLAIGEKRDGRKEVKFNLADPNTFKVLPVTLTTKLRDIDLGTRIQQYHHSK